MTRYVDGDDDDEFAALNYGRWERNARAALKGKRGRKALADLREALLALPEKRLIEGALCTVGGPERIPEVTGAAVDGHIARAKEAGLWRDWQTRDDVAGFLREGCDEERKAVARSGEAQGYGVCVNGALLWHRLVKGGMTAGEAFAALPAVTDADGGDPLSETARIAEKDAGIAYTLAYRNDETYGRMTPEERYAAFLAWIDAELGDSDPGAGSSPAAGTTATNRQET